MRTKGLMFIALFISGAAFGQTTTVKQEQQVKAGSNTGVNAAAGNQHVTAATNTSSEVNAGSASAVSSGQVSAPASIANNRESAVTVDPSAVSAAKGEVKGNVESGLETGLATGGHLEKQTVKAGKAAGRQVKDVTATAAHSAVHVNGTVNNSLKVKAAPVRVNTMTAGAVRLGGL
ncbi:hypothetical protein SAMN04488505_11138 [Chitinophaga rupis]|uniref:Uncharacterized protein n=1 Tax=Chitinophaga rupis TaxID=573321 RepID=A0A1H8HD88_9BACT|nr:hypothetical protein [Chitinophaga rupis]SEN54221.1 hypothetical protein SAMN04488505_11138 [Chitinophaga rupis]